MQLQQQQPQQQQRLQLQLQLKRNSTHCEQLKQRQAAGGSQA